MAGAHQTDIGLRRRDILDGFQQDMVAARMEDLINSDQNLHQEDIAEDPVGAPAQQDPDVTAALARKAARRRVGIVAQPACRLPHALACFSGDLHVGDGIQHEGDRGAGYPGRFRHISAGRSSGSCHQPPSCNSNARY